MKHPDEGHNDEVRHVLLVLHNASHSSSPPIWNVYSRQNPVETGMVAHAHRVWVRGVASMPTGSRLPARKTRA